MKLFGIVLLAAYFLMREEPVLRGKNPTHAVFRAWLSFFACGAAAFAAGWLTADFEMNARMACILLAAALPPVLLRLQPAAMIAGAFTAFWCLRFLPQLKTALAAFGAVNLEVLILAFLCAGLRGRMLRFGGPETAAGRLFALTAMLGLWILLHQKLIQLF